MSKQLIIKIFISLGAMLAGVFLCRIVIARLSPRQAGLGLTNGQLAPCPSIMNCVSSQSPHAGQKMEAIPLTVPAGEALAHLRQIIQAMPNTHIVADENNYLYVEFQTPIWHFIDDVEFVIDAPAGVIQFRSASRLGSGDGGTNRRRMEAIRAAFEGQ